jgi:hypothetical protein
MDNIIPGGNIRDTSTDITFVEIDKGGGQLSADTPIVNPSVRSGEADKETTPINLTGGDSPSEEELQHQKTSINLTEDEDAVEEGNNSCNKRYKHHDHYSDTDHGNTYENDKYSWTESCQIIEPFLPPSLSACYLYVQDKTKQGTIYTPGVCIINSPTENRQPEIFVCAVKCANTNEISFMYAKTESVTAGLEGKKINDKK